MSSYEAQPISAITAPLEIERWGNEVVFIGLQWLSR
jgi:hypothetical protein